MILITGRTTVHDVVAVARGREPVGLDAPVVAGVAAAHEAAAELSGRVPTYGRSTGVGANRLTGVPAEDTEHGMRLLRSHAVDAGDALDPVAVRAMLAVRLNQLAIPGSGIEARVLTAVAGMLNRDALPEIRELSSVGTGDLAALAGTALTLVGERPASRPLDPIAPFGADSALPFLSSSALTVGRAMLCVDELRRLDLASAVVYALGFLALRGNPSAFSATAATAAAAPGVERVALRLRGLLDDAGEPARIQDPYGLRAYPVTQGVVLSSVEALAVQAERTANTAQENPLFDLDDGAVVHHAGFYQAGLAHAVDATTLALAQSAPITLSRIRMAHDPALTGLRPFLSTGPAGSSGLMMLEYVAAAAVAELRAAAQPASLGTVTLSLAAEEGASFAAQGVVQLERALRHHRVLLACELVATVRALRQGPAGSLPADGRLGDAWRLLAALPAGDADRDLRPDVEAAQAALDPLAALAGPDGQPAA